MPIDMPGYYHKIVFKTSKDVLDYIASTGWRTKFNLVGDNDMFFGIAERT